MTAMRASLVLLWIGSTLLVAGGCRSSSGPTTSGFLGHDLSGFELREQTGAWVYVRPGADLSGYDSVLLDDVQVWMSPETRHRGVLWSDIRRYAHAFDGELRAALEGYAIVTEPGPTTLRLRVALTDVEPNVRGYSTRENLDYGEADGSGEVTRLSVRAVAVEAEFQDSQSGERLIAALARRSSDADRTDGTSWEAVRGVFAGWARAVRRVLDGTEAGA